MKRAFLPEPWTARAFIFEILPEDFNLRTSGRSTAAMKCVARRNRAGDHR
jgi:hypothetical protein